MGNGAECYFFSKRLFLYALWGVAIDGCYKSVDEAIEINNTSDGTCTPPDIQLQGLRV